MPPQGPIEPVVEDGVVRNAAGTIGVMGVWTSEARTLEQEGLRLLHLLTPHVAMHLEHAFEFERMRQTAERDPLTHLRNRRAFDEVFAQAVNILKTDYGTDVAEARKHAAGMSELLEKVLNGVDADKNGTVEPKMMEGGLNTALRAAGKDGL